MLIEHRTYTLKPLRALDVIVHQETQMLRSVAFSPV